MYDSIAGGIAAVNGSIELVRAIGGASGAIERAELQLKAVEVMGALAEVKLALLQSQEEANERQREIARLREALQIRGTVTKLHDAMYLTTEAGEAHGDAFCLQCWQSEHRLCHLIAGAMTDQFNHCANCKSKFSRSRSRFRADVTA